MSGKVMDLLGKDPSMSLSRLLALKQESDRIDQQQQVQQAMLMAQQGGQQMPQMPQMPPQGMPPQGMPQQGMPPQGMPQGAPQQAPTVAQELEQKVAASAAEPMRQGGIAGLPIDNFQPGNYANGGIIAFYEGAGGNGNDGPIKAPTYEEIVEEDDLARGAASSAGLIPALAGRSGAPYASRGQPESFDSFYREYQAKIAPFRGQTEEDKARAEEIKQEKINFAKQGYDDKWTNFALAGLGIAGGTSPYFAANLSKAAPALQNYAQSKRENKKQDLEYSKELANIARSQRMEGAEDVKAAANLYDKQLTRDIAYTAANKPNAAREYAYNHRDVMKAKGDPRSEKELINEGLLIHLREATKYDPAMRGIDIRGGQLGVDREEQLRKQREDEAKLIQGAQTDARKEIEKSIDFRVANPDLQPKMINDRAAQLIADRTKKQNKPSNPAQDKRTIPPPPPGYTPR
jgi:hypothetical protein